MAGGRQGITRFLKDYPGMAISPSRGTDMQLKGYFSFSAKLRGATEICDTYHLQISIPQLFPKKIPKVTEIDLKIPRDGEYHINPDNTLCLGSPLRLMYKISERPNLVGFAESCLVPYLYAVSYKLQSGDFPLGELAHGNQGIVIDYLDLFGLDNSEQVIQTLNLLGMKKRVANKAPCPCGCERRLGKCSFNQKLNKYRNIAKRAWYRAHARDLET
jgi:hypothetical protein